MCMNYVTSKYLYLMVKRSGAGPGGLWGPQPYQGIKLMCYFSTLRSIATEGFQPTTHPPDIQYFG